MTKVDIRNEMITLRNKIPEINRNIYNKKIYSNVLDYFDVESYNKVMLYRSYQSEASVNQLFDYYLDKGQEVILPKCLDRNGKMVACFISNKRQLRKGLYGIEEPVLALCDSCNVDELDAVFVPGVAFSKNGARIGYGKGYYDFFLQQRNPNTILIGVAYDLQISPKCDIVVESHDIKMNYIVTENQIYRCEEG